MSARGLQLMEEACAAIRSWTSVCRQVSPRSVFSPILRIISCGGSERVDSSIQQSRISQSSKNYECCFYLPLEALSAYEKWRSQKTKVVMASLVCTKSQKHVTFHEALVSSIIEIPRILDQDRHDFFFTELELEQLEIDRTTTSETENIEMVLIASLSQMDYCYLHLLYNDPDSVFLSTQKQLECEFRQRPTVKGKGSTYIHEDFAINGRSQLIAATAEVHMMLWRTGAPCVSRRGK